MEELKSTDVLDREILEDARKKAYKILKTADETLETQTRDWEEKTGNMLDSVRKNYAEKTKKETEEIFARLPLDKRRLRSETAENNLVKAMNDFLRSLPRETLLAVLEKELLKRLEACNEEGIMQGAGILYSGMELSEARGFFEKVSSAGDLNYSEDPLFHEFPGMVINTLSMKISASVEAAAAVLLKEKRAELAAALMGEEVLND